MSDKYEWIAILVTLCCIVVALVASHFDKRR
jgi:hypothetical protein